MDRSGCARSRRDRARRRGPGHSRPSPEVLQLTRVDHDHLRGAVAEHGDVRHGGLAERLEDLEPAARIVEHRAVDVRDDVSGLRPSASNVSRSRPGLTRNPTTLPPSTSGARRITSVSLDAFWLMTWRSESL